MCGLVGVVGSTMSFVDSKVFRQLLYIDALRGPHSTGVSTNNINGEVETFKRALNASDYLQLKLGEKISSKVTGDFLLGHNRYATQGAIDDNNAHPFTYGNVTLAHNGTLSDQTTLPDHKDFEVDSENIAYAMGLAENPEEVISKLIGAFALSWWNDHTREYYLVRNAERPLWLAKNDIKDTYYYASERYMLEAILSRNNIKYTINEVPVGNLVTFKFNDKGTITLTDKKVKIAPKPSVKPYKAPINNYYNTPKAVTYKGNTHPLARHNLVLGEEVEFYSKGLPDILDSNVMGILEGLQTDGKQLRVRAFNQPNNSLAGYYTGFVKAVVGNAGSEVLIVDTPWLLEIIEGDVNNKHKQNQINEVLSSQWAVSVTKTEQVQ
tara:strand:+ start:1248 stop:2387 length:1140 start_codon:yes stop_codon:yes gene_type:complete